MNLQHKSIDNILAEHAHEQEEGPLLPVLHSVQRSRGYIPEETFGNIAEALNISRAEVHGVASFYHDFRSAPAAPTLVRICRAEACQAVGARELQSYATSTLKLGLGESSETRGITLEAVYCLGNCACGPSVSINGQLHARVTPRKFDRLVTAAERSRTES